MFENDYTQFAERLDAAYELLGKTPAAKVISAGSKALFFGALAQYPLADVLAALNAHIQEGTFTPVPNDIKMQIERKSVVQWMAADEAWALVPKLEREPGLLNQVTASALSAASEFLDMPRPDMVAARMAFKAKYDRLVEVEKQAGRPPKYWPSPGGTHEAFEAVKAEGVRLGLLAPEFAPAAVPQLGNSKPPPGAMEALRSFSLKSLPPPEAE